MASFDGHPRYPAKRTVLVVLLAVAASVMLGPPAAADPNFAPINPVSPSTVANDGSKTLTFNGTGFENGATVKLTKSGQPDISGTNVTVGGIVPNTQMSATFNLTGVAPGSWSVVITNPDMTSDTCTDCLTITAPAPTVTSASPNSRGQGATSQNVTIAGTNFFPGAAASFSGTGITVNSTTRQSTTQVTANITIASGATVGARNVTVTNTDGQAGSCAGCFTVNAAPAPASVAPPAASNTGTARLTINGSAFQDGATVLLRRGGQPDIPGTSVVFNSATSISASFDLSDAAPGGWTVVVTNPDAGTGSCACFTVSGATPTVTDVDPDSGGQGADDLELTVSGTNFARGATASFSGPGITVNSTTFVSSTEQEVNIDITPGATPGARDVTVTNTDTLSGTCDDCFTVNAGPTVTSANPPSRGQGATDQDITISGTGFVEGADVEFSGTGITVNSTTFVDATTLTANIDVQPTATVGARNITVTNPDSGVGSCSSCFTVNAGPTVTNANPSSRGQGATNQNVSVTGTNFVDGAAATFSGTGITVNSTTFVNATTLTVNIDVAGDATPGPRTITVTNPDAGKGSCAGCFTVNAQPTVTSVDPASRGQGANNEDVTITGTGFVTGASVTFSGDGITVNSTTFESSTELTANIDVSGTATVGVRDVTVNNNNGGTTATCVGCFTVNAKPTVTNADPNAVGQGATNKNVTLTGTGFTDDSVASFSGEGITVNSTTFVNATTLTVNITVSPTATTGARTITVDNGDGGTPGTCSCFTVNAAPTVTSTTPSAANNTAPVELTITGTGFVDGAMVELERTGQTDIAGTSVQFVDATTLEATFDITNAAPGPWNVRVTNPDAGTGACSGCFTVAGSAPGVTSASPSSRGQGATNEDITITGTNFAMGAQVTFSGTGITVNSTTFVSPTQLTANITIASDAAPGARNVTVTNTDTQSGTCTGCFTVNAKPIVTSVSPSSSGQGATNQNVTITGTGFLNTASVSFSGTGITVNSTTFVSSTQMTVNIDVATNAPTGARDVTVSNNDGGLSGICTGCFTVASPTVTSASPSSRGQGATNQNITITGANFISGSQVAFSGTGITINSTSFVSTTTLIVNIDVAPGATVGVRNVTVSNGAGSTPGTCVSCFTVTQAPTVGSTSPVYGARGISGRNFAVFGSGFDAGTTLTFSGGGITVNSLTRNSSSNLTVNISIASDAALGLRSITVTDSRAGTSTCADCFLVIRFDDVPPSHGAFNDVDKIAAAGITAGCAVNPARYCPSSPITRGQMAVFMLRAMGHGDPSHLPAYRGIFADVPRSHPFARFIEHLYDHGVTAGCSTSPRRYCPSDPVTRGQMAVFLLRAMGHAGHLPAYRGIFADVPRSHPFARFIEHLFDHQVTAGCGTNPRRYCPGSTVTRGQMAIFVVEAFDL